MNKTKIVKGKNGEYLDNITSKQILALLEAKHLRDVFIPECKNGETWSTRQLLKLDAWCLMRTYSPLSTIGFEIKVSRSDFDQDQKWVDYLDLCHMFYFVCPAGLVRSVDLPEHVGLIWVSASGKLHTKKVAQRRQPDKDKLNNLLIYALMSRSRIVANMNEANLAEPTEQVSRLKQMAQSVADSDQKKELSRLVRGHVRKIWEEIRGKELKLESRERRIKDFEARLGQLGITWDSTNDAWMDSDRVNREIDLLKTTINNWVLSEMEQTGQRMVNLATKIRELRKE